MWELMMPNLEAGALKFRKNLSISPPMLGWRASYGLAVGTAFKYAVKQAAAAERCLRKEGKRPQSFAYPRFHPEEKDRV